MKLLPLWQPWASAVAMRRKRIETRGWSTDYRGPVAIFATKTWNTDCREAIYNPLIAIAMREWFKDCAPGVNPDGWLRRKLPFGRIIAVAQLDDCQPVETIFCQYPELDTMTERALGNYSASAGRYGFVLNSVLELATPIPHKGQQGKLLTVHPNLENFILESL